MANYISNYTGSSIDSAVARALALPELAEMKSGEILTCTSSNYRPRDFAVVFADNIGHIKLTGYSTPSTPYSTTPVSMNDTIPSAFNKVQSQICEVKEDYGFGPASKSDLLALLTQLVEATSVGSADLEALKTDLHEGV